MKHIVYIMYILVVVAMGVATITEKYHGTQYVSEHFYGAWWFVALWAILAGVAIIYFVRRHVRNASVVALHLSFIIILAGASLTYLTARKGIVHLRLGEPTDKYLVLEDDEVKEKPLPFSMALDKFEVKYHDGTTAESDYKTHFTITDTDGKHKGTVSMNNIYSYKGIRLYQSNYDNDMRGSVLSLNSDPWGIPVTYIGYALLFISLLWILIDPRGRFRALLRNSMIKKGVLVVAMLAVMSGVNADAQSKLPHVLPKETAEKFGELNILYNNRICPLQTFAMDFTKKLYGKASYKGLSAEQVLTGFIFWGDEWGAEPIIRMKNGPLRETLQLPRYSSVNTFFNQTMGGYILGPYVREAAMGSSDKFHKEVADIDDKLQLVMELRRGTLLKIFPYTMHSTTWYAPTDNFPEDMEEERKQYMRNIFSLLYEEALGGNFAMMDEALQKMHKYQLKYGGTSLPSPEKIKAERVYNAIPFATILFMLNLTVGFLALVFGIYRLARNKAGYANGKSPTTIITFSIMIVSFAALTLCLVLRWIIGGTVPMSNGYETMLLMAWFIMLLSLIAGIRFRMALPFGFILSGFFLLVSHISQMDPQITHIMPVLSSPLLSIHVSVIMMAFALLSMTFICGLVAVLLHVINRMGKGTGTTGSGAQIESLHLLSQLFLYPALAALGLGIFIGAIWANISWGAYWSWDPKEVWALITFMIYAIAVHDKSVPALRKPLSYHVFMTLAFLSILMTYFGVNYFLGGMHSYA